MCYNTTHNADQRTLGVSKYALTRTRTRRGDTQTWTRTQMRRDMRRQTQRESDKQTLLSLVVGSYCRYQAGAAREANAAV
jgi:hypothetical protein